VTAIDLNSDLGESFGAWSMGDDNAMLGIVTSANVACGFHAGDPAGMLRTLRQAARMNVAIGAHVGYRDLVGFGRRAMDPSSEELVADVIYQIGALQGLAVAAGTRVSYVKPHGALYNTIAEDARQAADVIAGIKAVDPSLILVALAGAPIVASIPLLSWWPLQERRSSPGPGTPASPLWPKPSRIAPIPLKVASSRGGSTAPCCTIPRL
jgi:UPF0271 protein